MEMKAYLIAAVLAVSNAWSTNISTDIKWSQASDTDFELTIVGTGLDYRKTITSPNGLWELSLLVEGNYDESLKLILVNNTITRGTFLGSPDQPRINSRSYMDPFAVGTPIFDTNWLDSDMSHQWKATMPYTITSIPDLSDNSTWTWVMNVTAHGPSLLTKPVPETGGIACLALAAGLLLFFRPRKEKAWTS